MTCCNGTAINMTVKSDAAADHLLALHERAIEHALGGRDRRNGAAVTAEPMSAERLTEIRERRANANANDQGMNLLGIALGSGYYPDGRDR